MGQDEPRPVEVGPTSRKEGPEDSGSTSGENGKKVQLKGLMTQGTEVERTNRRTKSSRVRGE